MPVFRYEAINTVGRIITGTHSAEIIQQVEKWLTDQGLSPIKIQVDSLETADSQISSSITRLKLSVKDSLTRVGLDDRILFCRQLATMLSAGIPVLQALTIITTQVKNAVMRKTILAISSEIGGGTSMSEAFAQYPKIFNQLFLNVIRIGEESGGLDTSFNYLADLYENEKDVDARIKTATRYPKLVIIAISSAIIFLMTFVVPKFVQLFSRASVSLPLPTRILIAVSDFFSNNFLLIIAGIVLLILAYRHGLRHEKFVLLRDHLLLKVPIFGDLAVKIFMSRFCRVFAVLTHSGIDVIKTLELSASALDNRILRNMLQQVVHEVEQGTDLNSAFAKHRYFPTMVVEMLAVGEGSGQVEAMMSKVAEFYDQETAYTIRQLSTLIEPIMLLFLGIIVATIALAIFMPMWGMMDALQ